MSVLTVIVRIFLFAILGAIPGYVAYEAIQKKRARGVRTAPESNPQWEDIKHMMPEQASDLDTPEIIAERRRIASTF